MLKVDQLTETDNDAMMEMEGGGSPPHSQQMGRRGAAASGSKQQKKQMKDKCGHCCTGAAIHFVLIWIELFP